MVDGPSGGFAGQLIASNYESKGASLYGFEAINASCHATSASCWPHLKRDDAMSTKAEPEPEDDLAWMVRRGRRLQPVAVSDQENQSASMINEISRALASTTTVTEILLPSEAAAESSVSSLLNEYSSRLDLLNPQHFLDNDDEAPINLGNTIVNPTNKEDKKAFANAHPGQQPGHPVMERPADFTLQRLGPKTTVTSYVGTKTVTHHIMEYTHITAPFPKVKTVQSTLTIMSYTGTKTHTVDLLHKVEARPTGFSFDLVGDRVVTLYESVAE